MRWLPNVSQPVRIPLAARAARRVTPHAGALIGAWAPTLTGAQLDILPLNPPTIGSISRLGLAFGHAPLRGRQSAGPKRVCSTDARMARRVRGRCVARRG
jgi:hypothetical protein